VRDIFKAQGTESLGGFRTSVGVELAIHGRLKT
jgi:hypothetical protein